MGENLGRSLEEIEKEIAEVQSELSNVQGTETEVYARIVGYYRAVRNWNKGKRDEFNHRKLFDIENTETNSYVLSTAADQAYTYDFSTQPLDSAVPDENQDSVHTDTNGHYEIFTRKTCPNCPPVKEFMEGVELSGRSIDVDTEEGLAEAAGKGVFASPTVIVYDSEGNETARAHNVEELSVIFAKITVGA